MEIKWCVQNHTVYMGWEPGFGPSQFDSEFLTTILFVMYIYTYNVRSTGQLCYSTMFLIWDGYSPGQSTNDFSMLSLGGEKLGGHLYLFILHKTAETK